MAKKDPLAALRHQRFCEYCAEKGWQNEDGTWNVATIAQAVGKKTAYTSNILNGHGSFGSVAAREFETKLGLPNNYFDGASDDDFVDVPRIDVQLAAGSGVTPQVEEVIGHLKFARSFLRSCGVSVQGARVVDVKGPSMEPTIKDGAVLLVSTSNREPAENQIFALVRPSEGLIVKRLMRQGEHWIARSDNRDHADFLINDGEPITILGRAIWMGAKL